MDNSKKILQTARVEEIRESLSLPPLGNERRVVDEVISLDEIMALKLFKIIEHLEEKILKGRIKDKENTKLQIEMVKAMVNACNTVANMKIYKKYNKDTIAEFMGTDEEQ